MPAFGYDGTIRIDSRIDPKGFNVGVKGLISALKPLGIAVAAIFSVRAITAFGKTAVDEASKMSSALIGLQSIVEGTGNSFSQAQSFINDYISDGLVPAQNAITAYKNLLARGYNTEQVQQTLTVLKDAAAFGRQASLSLGDAVQSATEGLKNENSILVDNAGITKNVSILWKEYADSIGSTVANLTKEQKIEAEVQGILRESRFQIGDAAKLAGTYAGQISALGVSFTNLKVAIGNTLIPIIQTFLPIIKSAVDTLTLFFNRLATIIGILFGVDIGAARQSMEEVQDASQGAADAQGQLAENTKETGKAAKGALAAFDQLNVLQQDTGAAGPADTGAGVVEVPALDTTQVDDSLDALRAKVEDWKQSFLDFVDPIKQALEGDLFPVLQKLGGQIWEGLQWVWENILKPFVNWFVQVFLPVFIVSLAVVLDVWSSTWEALKPTLLDIWENILQPFFSWLGTVAVQYFEWLTERLKELKVWIDNNQEAWAIIVITLGAVVAIIVGALASGLLLIIGLIAGIIFIIANWGKTWQLLKDLWVLYWEVMANVAARGVLAMQQNIENVFTGIKNFIKGIINDIIGFINGMISRIADGINAIVLAANTVGSVLPGFAPIGTVTAPQIPRLATGAVIPPNAQFAAILGDQKSGKNLEAPEGLIRQIIREELGNIDANIQIGFNGSLGQLVRELKPYIDKETVRIGGNLLASGVTR